MLFRLLLLLIVVPFVELSLLLWLADATQWWIALLVVIITGLVGALLARQQGWRTYGRIQHDLAAGRLPADPLMDALLILFAGALLLTPGMLTDTVGFSLLLPPCRHVIKRRLVVWFKSHFTIRPEPNSRENGDRIIDARVVDRSEE